MEWEFFAPRYSDLSWDWPIQMLLLGFSPHNGTLDLNFAYKIKFWLFHIWNLENNWGNSILKLDRLILFKKV